MDSVYQLRKDTAKLVSTTARNLLLVTLLMSALGIGLTYHQAHQFRHHRHSMYEAVDNQPVLRQRTGTPMVDADAPYLPYLGNSFF